MKEDAKNYKNQYTHMIYGNVTFLLYEYMMPHCESRTSRTLHLSLSLLIWTAGSYTMQMSISLAQYVFKHLFMF